MLEIAKDTNNKSWIRILETVGAEVTHDVMNDDNFFDCSHPLYAIGRQTQYLHNLNKKEEEIRAVFDEWRDNGILPQFAERVMELVPREKRNKKKRIII